MDGYLSAIMKKLDALMICEWNGLHGVNRWLTKEDVVWKVKINYVTNYFLSGWSNSEREQDGSFNGALQVVICLDGDYLINDIYLSVSYLFDEF